MNSCFLILTMPFGDIEYGDRYLLERRGVRIFEVAAHYLGERVLGMTDGKTIWLRKYLGYLRHHVLTHEIEHIKDMVASEYEIERRTRTRLSYACTGI